MSKLYITTVDTPDRVWNGNQPFHRYKCIVHDGWEWYLAEFNTDEQLDEWLEFTGIHKTLVEEKPALNPECGIWRRYDCDVEYDRNEICGGFWKLSEVPTQAKPILGHSNGSIVTCYIWNDGKQLHIYRPNPNAKEVYKPLSLEEHIKYMNEHGGI